VLFSGGEGWGEGAYNPAYYALINNSGVHSTGGLGGRGAGTKACAFPPSVEIGQVARRILALLPLAEKMLNRQAILQVAVADMHFYRLMDRDKLYGLQTP
jgi:hypothetical protein